MARNRTSLQRLGRPLQLGLARLVPLATREREKSAVSHRIDLFGTHVETWIWLNLKRKGTDSTLRIWLRQTILISEAMADVLRLHYQLNTPLQQKMAQRFPQGLVVKLLVI